MQHRQIQKYNGQQTNQRQMTTWSARTPPTINNSLVQRFGFDSQNGPMTKYSEQSMQYMTVEHEGQASKEFSIIKAILAFFVLLAAILVLIDFKNQKAVLLRESQLQIAKCQQDYLVNQCQTPTFNLESQCFEWNKCRQRKPHQSIKTSAILLETVGGALRRFVESAGITLLLVAIALIGFKIWQHSSKNEKKHK